MLYTLRYHSREYKLISLELQIRHTFRSYRNINLLLMLIQCKDWIIHSISIESSTNRNSKIIVLTFSQYNDIRSLTLFERIPKRLVPFGSHLLKIVIRNHRINVILSKQIFPCIHWLISFCRKIVFEIC